ncbi:hypothetical protein WN55_09329 [Dufourea novaeangliae]|uniref:Uncharacterized protein n=1 Tax=Dufourea novaeangliae TaxID=178035 RepID=A0A154P937_DUFNO|nr:hypothetical protein WN55_09329 [Dufourea novaeangliae]
MTDKVTHLGRRAPGKSDGEEINRDKRRRSSLSGGQEQGPLADTFESRANRTRRKISFPYPTISKRSFPSFSESLFTNQETTATKILVVIGQRLSQRFESRCAYQRYQLAVVGFPRSSWNLVWICGRDLAGRESAAEIKTVSWLKRLAYTFAPTDSWTIASKEEDPRDYRNRDYRGNDSLGYLTVIAEPGNKNHSMYLCRLLEFNFPNFATTGSVETVSMNTDDRWDAARRVPDNRSIATVLPHFANYPTTVREPRPVWRTTPSGATSAAAVLHAEDLWFPEDDGGGGAPFT